MAGIENGYIYRRGLAIRLRAVVRSLEVMPIIDNCKAFHLTSGPDSVCHSGEMVHALRIFGVTNRQAATPGAIARAALTQ